MNILHKKPKPSTVSLRPSTERDSWNPSLSGLRQSEREAYQLILELIEQEHMCELAKLSFFSAVETLSSAVHAQANGSMDDYYPKTLLAKKIETLLLEEPAEVLDSNVRQQAMLCTVALSQVKPPFHLPQKLDLVNAGVSSVFSLPLIMPSLDRKESASLYLQTVQALDDMLQALVMDNLNPNMLILQDFLEIILPWLTLSGKVHEQVRALGAISRLLRYICNFPQLVHMMSFSMSGRLMGILGLFCMSTHLEISTGASEALHYLFKILVLQRSMKPKTETLLKDLQKHFRGEWISNMQDLTLFFRKYLIPVERADVIMVALEAMTSASTQDINAASKLLKVILKYTTPEIGKVPEIIQYIYYHMHNITEATVQSTIRKLFYMLAQTYTDEVILTTFKMEDQSQKGMRKPWKILASFPKGYEMIMNYLLQRLTPQQAPSDREPSSRTDLSPLIATRAIHELLLEPSRRMEVQALFSSLFLALLFQVSFLVLRGSAEAAQNEHQAPEWVDPVSASVETLKTLMSASGYVDPVTYVQRRGGWELLVSPERHHDGVALLARSLVVRSCWHNRPIFSLLIQGLQDLDWDNHNTALVFLIELLECPDVAALVDDIATHTVANWFNCEEPATVKLLLRLTEVFTKHRNMVRRLHILQPHVLACCYSCSGDIATEAFLLLQRLVTELTWQHSSHFLVQLAFAMVPFFEEEAEHLRLMAFQIYGSLVAKLQRRILVFPLRHQIYNLIVPLVLHLNDVNRHVVEICRLTLCNTAHLLGWSRLKAVMAEKDAFTILGALLQQAPSQALWLLRQSTALFKSPQAPIRHAAVWFAGQIIQTLYLEEMEEIEEPSAALRSMQKDPDPMVSCLATQIAYVLEARQKQLLANPPSSCLCVRRPKRRHF